MKRSSKAAISVAAVLLAAICLLVSFGGDSSAGPMTADRARTLIARASDMLTRKDANGIIALMAPNARILNRSPEQMRAILQDALQQMGSHKFTVVTRNLRVQPAGLTAIIMLDMDLDERELGANIHYYTAHLTVSVEKVQTSRWLGLSRSDDWRITDVQSDSSLDVPSPNSQ